MCKKKNYCGSRIDECLTEIITHINKIGYKTLSSCCGHGKYPKTIIVYNSETKSIFEWFSATRLIKPKLNRFYKRDKQGYYYLNSELIIEDGVVIT